MEYGDDQKRAFRQEYRRRRTRNLVTVLPGVLVVIAVGVAAGRLGLSDTARLVASLAVALVVLGLSVRTWRCPACNRYLGKSLNPVACRHCDFTLRT